MRNRATIESMKRRKKRHAIPIPNMIGLCVLIVLVGLIWGLGLIVSYRNEHAMEHNQKHLPHERRAKAQQRLTEKILHGMPVDVDLWPLDERSLDVPLKTCLPIDKPKKCQQRTHLGKVGILRTPSVLGIVLEDFVRAYYEIHSHQDKAKLELVPTSHIDSRERMYTKVIRVTVLPLLLEAVDLALQTVDEEFTRDLIRLDDVLGVARLLVRWHCRLSDVATDTALENLSFSKTMGFTKYGEDTLEEFFSFEMIHDDKGEEVNVNAEDLALKSMDRLDECIQFMTELQGKEKQNAAVINQRIEKVIAEEAEHEHCQTTMNMLDRRVTEIVGHFLAVSEHTARIICHKYPAIPMCVHEYPGKPH